MSFTMSHPASFSYLHFQVSQVYQTMNIDNLSKTIPFFDFSVVEKISVDAVKHNFLAMKVDYVKDAVFFGNKVTLNVFCQLTVANDDSRIT